MKLGEILNNNLSTNSIDKMFKDNSSNIKSVESKKDSGFAQALTNAIDGVNESQETSYNAMKDIATGEVKNLQEAVVKIEKADINLKLALVVQNKAIGAYKEIMRMQI